MPNVRGVGAKFTAGAVPSPAKGTDCVMAPLPPVMVKGTLIWAVRSPPAEGVKDTVTVQVPVPAVSVFPEHVSPPLVKAKSERFVPVIVRVWMLVSTAPMFDTVTVWGVAVVPTNVPLNVKVAGEKLMAGAMPEPVSEIFSATPLFWVTVTAALNEPMVPGLKVTLIVHVPLTAKVDGSIGQSLVWWKAVGLRPVILMLSMVSAELPLLVTVTVCAVLVVFSG